MKTTFGVKYDEKFWRIDHLGDGFEIYQIDSGFTVMVAFQKFVDFVDSLPSTIWIEYQDRPNPARILDKNFLFRLIDFCFEKGI